MIVSILQKSFGDEVASCPDRQDVDPDVIAKVNKRVIIPEKFRADIEALMTYTDSGLESGLCITVSLSELLTVCPRARRRIDAYNALVKFLRDEMNVKLTITTSKAKEL